jgi:hypothetical protein
MVTKLRGREDLMLKSFACIVLLSAIPVLAQDTPKRIALTEKSDVPTADILKGLQKECPNVSITNDVTKSDYTLEAIKKTRLADGTEYDHFALTLFDRDGKAVYSTSTRRVGNAVKDVCTFIHKK